MKSPLALLLCLAAASPVLAQPPQSTGMGVVMKDPTPREPDPRVVLGTPPSSGDNDKHLQALRAQRQAQVLADCNQILILAHQLHLSVVEPAAKAKLPSNAAMTSKIAELASKLQKDLQVQ